MVIVQKKGGTWWKCLLAFFGGILFTIGAVLGGAAIVGTQIQAGTLLGENADAILTAEYQSKTLLQIAMGFIDGSTQIQTLGDVAKITPMVDNVIAGINETLEAELSYKVNIEQMHTLGFAEIPDYLVNSLKNEVTLAGAMKIDENSEAILQYLAFPKNEDGSYNTENPYPLANYMDDPDFLNKLVTGAKINDLMTADDDNLLMKSIGEFTIEDLQSKDKIYGIKLGDLFSDEEKADNALLKTISDKDWTIADLSDGDNLKTLKIGELVETSEGTLLDAIKEKTINDLDSSDAFDDVKLDKVITIDDDSSPILKYLKDKSIGELKDDDLVNDMYISDIFTTDEINDSRVLKALNNLPNPEHIMNPSAPEYGCKVGDIGERVNELLLEDVIDCDDTDSKIIKTLRHKRIDQLSESIDELMISDVMDYYYEESTGKYWTNTSKDKELAPVLVKLIGNEPFGHEYPGYQVTTSTYTINREIDGRDYEYIRFVDKNGEDYKVSDYYKIDDFLQNTLITVSKHVDIVDEEEVVSWVAAGSGAASPARDEYATSFEIEIAWPSEWTGTHYVNICNKPTKVNDFGDVVSDLKLKDVMNIDEDSPLNKPRIKNAGIGDADNLFNVIKEDLSIGDVIDHYEDPDHEGIYYSDPDHIGDPAYKLPMIVCTFIQKDIKLDGISDAVNDLKFGDVVENYEKSPSDGKYYKDPECTEELPQILQTFIGEGVEINDMANRIKYLTIGDALSESDRNEGKFLKLIPEDTYITDIGGAINNISIIDAFEDEIFEDTDSDGFYDSINSTWKYLLLESKTEKDNLNARITYLETYVAPYDEDHPFDPFNREAYDGTNAETGSGKDYIPKCNGYTIGSSMGQMIDNMSTMMEQASLQELDDDGILDLDDTFLGNDIAASLLPYAPAGKTKYGQLTIKEFTDMVGNL